MAQQPLLHRDTGAPMKLPTATSANTPMSGTQTQTTAPSSTTGKTSAQEATSSAVSSVQSSVNTTPGALAALESLINQLTSRPDINPAALEAKYPHAVKAFSPTTGWYFVNPKTGMSLSPTEVALFNAKQDAAKEAEIKAAPIIEGGTPEQKAQKAERKTEIDRNRQQQANYSKEAAGVDANALIQKAVSDALEAALPQITAGLEGAGTSRSTIAAGLTQKAALKGATEGAALAANLGAQYGQINTQLSGVLEALTRSDPNSPEAMLLNAIVGSKGLVTMGTGSQVQVGSGYKAGTTEQNEGPKMVQTDFNRQPTAATPTPGVMPAQNPGLKPFSAMSNAEFSGYSGGPSFMSIVNTTDQQTGPVIATRDSGLFVPPSSGNIYADEEQ